MKMLIFVFIFAFNSSDLFADNKPSKMANHYHGKKAHKHFLPNIGLKHQHNNGVLGNIQTTNTKLQVSKYIDHGDGTVTDTTTGLMWKKCSEGLNGENCLGKAKLFTWSDAMQRHTKSNYAGYNDWYIPTINEIGTLVYCSNGVHQREAWNFSCNGKRKQGGAYKKPTINQIVFPQTYFWSSSLTNINQPWVLFFFDGVGAPSSKKDKYYLRLVRKT